MRTIQVINEINILKSKYDDLEKIINHLNVKINDQKKEISELHNLLHTVRAADKFQPTELD